MYWTVNQIDGSLADRVTNEIAPAQKGACTHSKHIARIINIVFDCDAVRPIGWPATDEEHAATLEVAYKIKAYLASLGFPEPAVFDSGNGTYLIYKTDLSPELKPLVRAFVEYVSKQFSTRERCEVWLTIRSGSCRRFSAFRALESQEASQPPNGPTGAPGLSASRRNGSW